MADMAWVIETGEGPLYWTGKGVGPSSFSKDHRLAVRFVRKIDAQGVMYGILEPIATYLAAREHSWVGPQETDNG